MKPHESNINFIKHFLVMNEMFYSDSRLSPFHLSLYNALFLEWNHCGFQNPISVSRGELMNMSKIGSVNSYTKVIKELHAFGYIEYQPSFNRFVGSKIIMFTFDKASNNGLSKGSDNAVKKPMIPYINYNKTIETNKTLENGISNQKEQKIKINSHSFPQNLQEIKDYFQEKEFNQAEAEKFFNYYESNGWMVGKNKMKNWKAAANNWLLNSKKFNPVQKDNHYHTNQDKDYSVPL